MTINGVPNQPREGRSVRSFRVDDDDWDELAAVADSMDVDRGWIVRQLVRWYLRRDGVLMPPRPGEKP